MNLKIWLSKLLKKAPKPPLKNGQKQPVKHHTVPQWFLRKWANDQNKINVLQTTNGLVNEFQSPPRDLLCGAKNSNAVWFDDFYMQFEDSLFKKLEDHLIRLHGEITSEILMNSENSCVKNNIIEFVFLMSLRSNLVQNLVFSDIGQVDLIVDNQTKIIQIKKDQDEIHDTIMMAKLAAFILIADKINDEEFLSHFQNEQVKKFRDDIIQKFSKNNALYSKLHPKDLLIEQTQNKSFILSDEPYSHIWLEKQPQQIYCFPILPNISAIFIEFNEQIDNNNNKIIQYINGQTAQFSEQIFYIDKIHLIDEFYLSRNLEINDISHHSWYVGP